MHIAENNNVTSCARMESVEIQCAAGKSQYYFPDTPVLKNAQIIAIEIPNVTSVPKSQSGRALVNATIANVSKLTLVEPGLGETINDIPIKVFDPSSKNGRLIQFGKGKQLNLPKSYININDITSLSASESFVVIFYYDEIKK